MLANEQSHINLIENSHSGRYTSRITLHYVKKFSKQTVFVYVRIKALRRYIHVYIQYTNQTNKNCA